MIPTIKIVENAEKALEEIKDLYQKGFEMDDVYVLAHQADVTHKIAAIANTKEIGIAEEGIYQSLANVFKSRGDELRDKLVSLGISEVKAANLERQLDQGHVAIINISKEAVN
jgi:5-bromo-4-chloroindolyl phosphate hydrolysis protein